MYVRERGALAAENGRAINLFLKSQIVRAEGIMLEAERKDQTLTFRQFKDQFINIRSQDFFIFCRDEITKRESYEKYSTQTIKSNWLRLKKLKSFRSNVYFLDINLQFLEDYEAYLRMKRKNSINTIFAAMKFIRTMLNAARKQKITDIYPFDEYKLVYEKNTRDRLLNHELEKVQCIYDENQLLTRQQKVLKYFLFACYTGLTWGDLVSLDYEEIERRGAVAIITKKRQKTGNQFIVPLISMAKRLIDLTQKRGKVFPKILSNQKANQIIKEVIASAKIHKKISFHCARYTFGTVALNKGIPRESIQRMLGHSKEEMTKLYSKLQDETIIQDMQKWENDNSIVEYKQNLSNDSLSTYDNLRGQMIASRIIKGISEGEIAVRLEINEQKYKKMENGELQFGMAHFLELGRYLKLDTKALFNQIL